jgi:hypothetical protein
MLCGLGVLFVVACGTATDEQATSGDTAVTEIPADLLDQARRTVDAAKSDYLSTLLEELRAHGPAKALHACSMDAQDLARIHSMWGARLRRVTLKVRNPEDTPDEFERGILEEWEALHQRNELPEEYAEIVTAGDRRTLRYLKPIVVMRPCLSCHGAPATMDPEVVARLGELYPDDEAIGYKEGDLRGAFSVTMDLTERRSEPQTPGQDDGDTAEEGQGEDPAS